MYPANSTLNFQLLHFFFTLKDQSNKTKNWSLWAIWCSRFIISYSAVTVSQLQYITPSIDDSTRKQFIAWHCRWAKVPPWLVFVWNDRERLMQRESTGENKFGRRNLKKICLKYLSSQGPWTSTSEQVMKSGVYNKKYFGVWNRSRIVFRCLAVKHVDQQEAKTENNNKNQEQQNFNEYDKHLPLRDPASF